MNLSQVECFLEIVKTGSFTKTADKLFITQQGVSRQIKALEKYLGFPLFLRTKNGIELTEEGALLASEWESSFYGFQTAVDKAKDMFLGKSRILKVALEDMGIATDHIVESFADFEQKEEALSIEFKIMAPSEIRPLLLNGTIDYAIAYEAEFRDMTGLKNLPLNDRQLDLAAIMGAAHPLTGEPFDIYRFLQQPFGTLSDASSNHFKEIVRQIYDHYGVSVSEQFIEFQSRRELLVAVMANRCVSVMYEPSVYEEKEKLFTVPLSLKMFSSRIGIFWAQDDNTIKAKNLSAVIHNRLQVFN